MEFLSTVISTTADCLAWYSESRVPTITLWNLAWYSKFNITCTSIAFHCLKSAVTYISSFAFQDNSERWEWRYLLILQVRKSRLKSLVLHTTSNFHSNFLNFISCYYPMPVLSSKQSDLYCLSKLTVLSLHSVLSRMHEMPLLLFHIFQLPKPNFPIFKV